MSRKQSKFKLNCLRVHWTGIKRCAGNYFSLSSRWQIRQGLNKWIRGKPCVSRTRGHIFNAIPYTRTHTHTNQYALFFSRRHGDNRMHNIASIFFNGIRPTPPCVVMVMCPFPTFFFPSLFLSFFLLARYARFVPPLAI